MDDNYIVDPFRKPRTPVMMPHAGKLTKCPVCGNDDPNRFLTVTGLSATNLRGYVCAPCEATAIDSR